MPVTTTTVPVTTTTIPATTTTTPATTTVPETKLKTAEVIKAELKKVSPELVKIASMSNNEFKTIEAEVVLSKLTDAQKSALNNMTVEQLEAEIKKTTDAISTVNMTKISDKAKAKITEVQKSLPVDAKIMPINFTAHAEFAFPVEVSISVDKTTYPSGTYYLYYYNEETGKVEDCGTVIVDANGVATFTISHCSDYFISSKTVDLKITNAEKSTETLTITKTVTTKNPKTSESNTVVIISLISILSVTALTVVSKKRKFKVVKKG